MSAPAYIRAIPTTIPTRARARASSGAGAHPGVGISISTHNQNMYQHHLKQYAAPSGGNRDAASNGAGHAYGRRRSTSIRGRASPVSSLPGSPQSQAMQLQNTTTSRLNPHLRSSRPHPQTQRTFGTTAAVSTSTMTNALSGPNVSKLVAAILLNRVHAVGKPMRRRGGPTEYVRSSLSACVASAAD